MSQFQVVRSSLEFVLPYGGLDKKTLKAEIEATGRIVSRFAQDLIDKLRHPPGERTVRVVAPLLGEWFDREPTQPEIYAKALSLGLKVLHPFVALHLAARYARQPGLEWIYVGHRLIPNHYGDPSIFRITHGCFGNRFLSAAVSRPVDRRDLDDRFAFGTT